MGQRFLDIPGSFRLYWSLPGRASGGVGATPLESGYPTIFGFSQSDIGWRVGWVCPFMMKAFLLACTHHRIDTISLLKIIAGR